jgi:hypothetical protein
MSTQSINIVSFTSDRATLSDDSGISYVWATAVVRDHQGFPVEGQLVRFKSNFSAVQVDALFDDTERPFVTNRLGRVDVLISTTAQIRQAGATGDIDIVVGAYIDNTKHRELRLRLVEGGAAYIEIVGDFPMESSVNGEPIEIRARVRSSYGLMGGQIVRFASNDDAGNPLGSLSQVEARTISDPEHENFGYAITQFIPGSTIGTARVSAFLPDSSAVDSVTINIKSDQPAYLQFTNANPINLNVQGSGGVESATISVRLFDMSGNVVTSNNHDIVFRIEQGLEGVRVDGEPWSDDFGMPVLFPVSSNNGTASISISSGIESGPLRLTAYLESDPTIRVTRANIIVHAGTPSTAAIYLPRENSGRNMGAGSWRIIVAANITDMYTNPVSPGVGVSFSIGDVHLGDPTRGGTLVDTAHHNFVNIFAPAFVGNFSVEGDSAAGHAYTTLTYHGSYSNYWVEIIVNAGDVQHSKFFKLPMQSPSLDVIATPQYIEWTPGVTTPVLNTVLRVMVVDGQGIPIFNAPLTFTSDRGIFRDFNDGPTAPFNVPPTITGQNTYDINGVHLSPANSPEVPSDGDLDGTRTIIPPPVATPHTATTDFNGLQLKRFYYARSLFPDVPAPPAIMVAQITVTIHGVPNTARQVPIELRLW